MSIYDKNEYTYEVYKKMALEAKDDIRSIRDGIFGEVSTSADLVDLNSTSATARWRLLVDLFAFICWYIVMNWLRYEAILDEKARNCIPHTAWWYVSVARAFQYGDALVMADGTPRYPIIDTTKQIVSAASLREAGGRLYIKVAKQAAGGLMPLAASELLAFQSYIDTMRDAGVRVACVSQNPDVIRLVATIYYNAMIPIAVIQPNVIAAVGTAIQGVEFDGKIRLSSVCDAIQSVTGVVDYKIDSCAGSVSYTTIPTWVVVDAWYETVAGYAIIDPNYPLSATLNFQAV